MSKLPNWKSLVSTRVGIVSKLEPQYRLAEEPTPPYLYTATLSHFDMKNASLKERLNAGKGPTEEFAKLSAVAEAAERYCGFQMQSEKMFNASTESLTENKIAPDELVLFADHQYEQPNFGYHKYAPNHLVTWVRGVDLSNREPIAIPASQVYMLGAEINLYGVYTPTSSNGLAAGSCNDMAALGGFCELVERDAFLITWMNRLPVQEIEIPDIGICGSLKRHYCRIGVELRTFLMRTDQLPYVVMTLAFDETPNRPARVLGLGCELDPHVAMEKSIFEFCQARPSSQVRWDANKPYENLHSPSDVKTLDDHADLYSLPKYSNQFDFLWSTGERVTLADLPSHDKSDMTENLNNCVDRLAETGYRAAFVDLTLPDVESAGFRVVRTVATGLQPIHFGNGHERLGGQRLFQLPVQLGLQREPNRFKDLNPFPHPLA